MFRVTEYRLQSQRFAPISDGLIQREEQADFASLLAVGSNAQAVLLFLAGWQHAT